jgi:hypothetical protein
MTEDEEALSAGEAGALIAAGKKSDRKMRRGRNAPSIYTRISAPLPMRRSRSISASC